MLQPSYSGRFRKSSMQKTKRDWWDKAPIISTFLSSVVIAIVGIYISASFQQSQLAITKQNNEAQLKISAQKNESEVRLQELKMASDLLEPLLSSDPRKRRIAALMLPSALSDHEICQKILAQMTTDRSEDASVRRAAMTQLGAGTSKANALVLESVRKDPSLPEADRQYAGTLAQSVALGVDMPSRSAFFFGSSPGKIAFESDRYGGGVFTYYLTKGLAGEADSNNDGTITVSELYQYLQNNMSEWQNSVLGSSKGIASRSPDLPSSPSAAFMRLSGNGDMPVLTRQQQNGKRRAVVVGVSKYETSLSLRFPIDDANKIAEVLGRSGIEVVTLQNPTDAQLIDAISRSLLGLSQDDSFYFFFSGHGWMSGGENYLGGTDVTFNNGTVRGGVSLQYLKSAIQHANLRSSFGFFDICQRSIDKVNAQK